MPQCIIFTNHNVRKDGTCKRFDACRAVGKWFKHGVAQIFYPDVTQSPLCTAREFPLTKKEVKKLETGTIQNEGQAHIEEDAKAGTNAPDVKVKKTKAKKTKAKVVKKRADVKAPEPAFPAETSINAYAFIRVPAKVMEYLGIKTEKNSAGKTIFKITKAVITGFDESTGVLSVKIA